MGWLANRPVRVQVTVLATLMLTVVLGATGAALLVVQQRSLTAAVDDGLRLRADDLAGVLATAVPDSLPGTGDDDAVQIVAPDGRVLVASPNLAVAT